MAKVTTIQTNFTGGELSPRLEGRIDVTKVKNGLRLCQNFQVLPHGGARKRSGTKFVVECRSASDDLLFVPFVYNTEQTYMLAFGPGYVWFFKDQGIITHTGTAISSITKANPAVVEAIGHGLANDDWVVITGAGGMTEVNNRRFQVTGVTANQFQLVGVDSTNYGTYTSGGTVAKIVQLATDYSASDVANLQWAQTNDTLYLVCGSKKIRTLTRSSHTSWTLTDTSITTGPFRTLNTDGTRLTVSSFSGSATAYGTHIVGETFTLTSTLGIFTSSMVGALIRLWEDGGGTGIGSAPLGQSIGITTGNCYTNDGKVYGIAGTSGSITWVGFTRVPEHDTGRVRVRSNNGTDWFDSDFLHPTYCIVRITGYVSETQVTAQIVRYQMPRSIVDSGTEFWEEGAWSDRRGYPKSIAWYEQRLFFGGSDSEPTALWASKSGAYLDFTDGTEDDSAIVYRLASGRADVIRWLQAGRVLTCGTSSGEFAVAASNQNEALTPTNFKVTPQTSYGTSEAQPVRFNQTVLYPQRRGNVSNAARKLREYSYSFTDDAFNSVDLTIFAEHIMGDGFDEITYLLEPDSLIVCRRTDGTLAICTYERAQEVVAWHRHVLGGSNVSVLEVNSIPGAAGDELWLHVQRTVNGSTVRYIEVLQQPFRDTDTKEDAFMVDCGLTYSGSSATIITGLWHLRGESVKVLSNGNVESGTVSSTGTLTLARATTKAHIGYVYTAALETEDFEAGAQAGTAQSRQKRISQVYLRVLSSLGGKVGADENTLQTLYYRTASMEHGSSPDLYSGFLEVDMRSGWDRAARVRIEHSDPLPFHVTGVVAELNVTG